MLREYLTHANARELLTAACGKSKRGIAQMLAERFPQARPADAPRATCPFTRTSAGG